MRYEDIVVDGEVDHYEGRRLLATRKGRQLVAGLRLLRAYGKLAERVLEAIERGEDVSGVFPLLERTSREYKNCYSLSKVPVHPDVPVPPLPDYSSLSVTVERVKPKVRGPISVLVSKREEERSKRKYTIRAIGPAIGVFPNGHVREIACDDIVGSVWSTKNRLSWSFSASGGMEAVRDGIATSMSNALVKLASDGTDEVWHSKAVRVHHVLRGRSKARILLDGHAERIRREVANIVAVDSVHEL